MVLIFIIIFVLISNNTTAQTTKPEWRFHTQLQTPLRGHRTLMLPDGNVIITGGLDNTDKAVASCYIYDYKTAKIEQIGSLNNSRAYHALVIVPKGKDGATIFAIGGYSIPNNNYEPISSVEVLDYTSGSINLQWRLAGNMTSPRGDCEAVWDKSNSIIVTGGFIQNTTILHTGKKTASTEIIDIGSLLIRPLPDMSKARGGHFLGMIIGTNNNYEAITAGGEDIFSSSTEILENLIWSSHTFAPKEYRSFATAFGDISGVGRMFGGLDSLSKPKNTCEWYDVKSGWKYSPSMTRARAYAPYTLIAGVKDTVPSYMVVGGQSTSSVIGEVEYFTLPTMNVPAGGWSQFYTLNQAGAGREIAITGNNLPIVIGGEADGLRPISNTEMFQPLSASDIQFPPEEVGRIADSIPLFIKNEWLLPVTVTDFRFDRTAEFFLTGDTSKFTLPAGSQKRIFVWFRPGDIGVRTGKLLFNVGGLVDTVLLQGIGMASSIGVVTNNLNFGEVFVGKDSIKCFPAIKNNGTDTTYIDSISIKPSSDYVLVSPKGRIKIAPDSTLEVCIKFQPGKHGDIMGTSMIHIAGRQFPCALSGKGISKYLKAFGYSDCDTISYEAGKSYPAVVVLQNTSDRDVTVNSCKFIGNAANFYKLITNLPMTVTIGGRVEIRLEFYPPAEGTYKINVEFDSDGIKDSLEAVPVCFASRTKGLNINIEGLSYNQICPGDSVQNDILIENLSQFETFIIDSINVEPQDTNISVEKISNYKLFQREKVSPKISFKAGLPGKYDYKLYIYSSSGTKVIDFSYSVASSFTFKSIVPIYRGKPGSNIIVNFSYDAIMSNNNRILSFVINNNSSVLWPTKITSVTGYPEVDEANSQIEQIKSDNFRATIRYKKDIQPTGNAFGIEFEVLLGNSQKSIVEVPYSLPYDRGYCIYPASSVFFLDSLCGGRNGLVHTTNQTLLSIFPNPVNGELSYIIKEVESKKLSFQILNSIGEIVERNELNFEKNSILNDKIDVSGLSGGLYMLRLMNESGVAASQVFTVIK
jgi:hypothetical protein